ncbi:phosphoribosylamine--glycine ligase [Crassaminicella thermophila]|uniref:Phosphoribosylamine--glycine ligase n=1 Tax=Crassaminicella thermophila TaxID=2599308 RepID=A0A5C0SF03_CRATE|nr:phosphoribosylamine--glycine ligase [Crassaminicella thermophila]QEK13023.1 phosphoribosylamine--glycine ligase [Crassaminicella thermophila]
MKVLVVGSGGREHTIVWKLRKSPRVDKIYCAPGNAGIGNMAEIVDIDPKDIEGLCDFAKSNNIDLTVVGPEVPLVLGIVDRFEEEGLVVFGPNKKCAQLEGSKAFTKDFLIRHNIPTGNYEAFIDIEEAKKAIGIYGYPMVIKADGLAAGKGVVIAQNEEEAIKALEDMMAEKTFGEAGEKVVIEEYLTGIETSILCFVDGESIVPMVSAQDYKKVFDEDKGPNTGGMGTYSPSYIYDEKLRKEVEKTILVPIIEGFKKDGLDFKGILFIGLMITQTGPKVLEFNVRFGDPETQTVLTRLETDLVEIIECILEGKLKDKRIKWSDKKAVCVVVASGGYPGSYEKEKEIHGLEDVDEDIMVFHAGTKAVDGKVLTNGGRVLGVTAWGDTINEAREKAYENVEKIYFDGMYYRKDIGKFVSKLD